jgi:DeoR/GlpR family transcriptional regulator of sugar metabolism
MIESSENLATREDVMHESERHRIILSAVQERPVITVPDLCQLTGASEATIRRDIAQLHMSKKLRRVRGGAEAIAPPSFVGIMPDPSRCKNPSTPSKSAPLPARR